MIQAPNKPDSIAQLAAAFDISDAEIAEVANRAAASVQRLANQWTRAGTPDDMVLLALRRIVRLHRVALPAKDGLKQRVNRMADPGWWRRALRQRLRAVELREIQRGAVHRQATSYVSAKAMRRFERNRKRLAELLATLEAMNEITGEVVPLQDLIDASQANPANRRKAMMARVKGIEVHSKEVGHRALFLTITCPSRMHPRHFTGGSNDRYDGTSPRMAQAYLGRLWSKATRYAAHRGFKPYGMRVVEPHHDACPHWHVLVFIAPEQAEGFTAAVRAYALADSPNEPGAQERRFTVEQIDPAKGSAVGYVAKYVSKSIDGEGLATDDESDDSGKDASRRIVAWARTWGIRQFQFFGVPTITPTRELYRLDGVALPGPGLKQAHEACKANDYAAWLTACQVHGLRFKVSYSERASTRYADETTKAIHGLMVTGDDLGGLLELVTRTEAWRIQPRQKKGEGQGDGAGQCPAPGSPWTRFNNSAPIDLKGVFDHQSVVPAATARPVRSARWHEASEKYQQLMDQSMKARAAGYIASANKMLEKAWRWAQRREAAAPVLPSTWPEQSERRGHDHA